jgi:hypothetical protein
VFVAKLVLMTADEVIALDAEGRGKARFEARTTPVARQILGAFLERGGPLPVGLLGASPDALAHLDNTDLIRIHEGHIDVAYPFSAAPTAFVVRLPDGKERYACCATDALGIAPMVGLPVKISTRCHDCGTPLEFSSTPEGLGADAAGVMLWVGERTDERCRSIDGL